MGAALSRKQSREDQTNAGRERKDHGKTPSLWRTVLQTRGAGGHPVGYDTALFRHTLGKNVVLNSHGKKQF